MSTITILDMYPSMLNVNGDGGNVLALTRRLQWAGVTSRVIRAKVGSKWFTTQPDIVHIGGGTVAAQQAVRGDLVAAAPYLKRWAADEVSILGVAGGFHLLLDEIHFPGATSAVAGLGLLGGSSAPAETRISEYLIGRAGKELVYGYQNSGQVVDLESRTTSWAQVLVGVGNRTTSGTEGAVSGSVLGTNLNGPLLPRNPVVADVILTRAASRQGIEYTTTERHAHADAVAQHAAAVVHERVGASAQLSATERPPLRK